ncbi:hypothetical protein FGO68_gene1067 [Halteria grandinella]|uniref:Uncharacterized protein n=1 Tax=Halteria grandinella TaxID=5974 RepID=A0A8J8P3P2_HALGN|nr:hypothetical protein FGO68_gene1067 [Halteria grandinella]
MSDGSSGGTAINLYQAFNELLKVLKLNGTLLKDLLRQFLSLHYVRQLWGKLKDKLRENPELTIKAAHALILLCLFLLVRGLLRVIHRIDVRRELSQRRMKVETWSNLAQSNRMQFEDAEDEMQQEPGTYRVFDRKFRELDQYKSDMQCAVVSYNHDDDTFDIVKPLNMRNDEEDEEGVHQQQSEDVAMVERILGERKEVKESNALRFLSDLHQKKHKAMLDNILTTQEGPQILKSQKQKLLEESTLIKRIQHNPHVLLQSSKPQDEENMSVDEFLPTNTAAPVKSHLRIEDQKVQIDARDLKQKDNYLFFELIDMYMKNQMQQKSKKL